jgi:hypothetical protein
MRVVLTIIIVAALLLLDWLALSDILRREPNLALEYFTIVLSGLVYGGVAGYWVRRWRLQREGGSPEERE